MELRILPRDTELLQHDRSKRAPARGMELCATVGKAGMYLKGKSISRALQERVLDEALVRLVAAGRGVVVFDLDSTVFDNRPRQALILREFGRARGIAAFASARPEHITSWSLREAMRNLGLDEAEAARVGPEARAFWRERFFTSEYCVHDHPIPGAVAFTCDVLGRGGTVAYVTGRHLPMGDGTRACLGAFGFPLPDGERVHLALKPDFATSDDAWKEGVRDRVGDIAGGGRVLAVFDNEPAHVNTYAAHFPGALAVHMATDDSGRPIPLCAGVPSIADFARRDAYRSSR